MTAPTILPGVPYHPAHYHHPFFWGSNHVGHLAKICLVDLVPWCVIRPSRHAFGSGHFEPHFDGMGHGAGSDPGTRAGQQNTHAPHAQQKDNTPNNRRQQPCCKASRNTLVREYFYLLIVHAPFPINSFIMQFICG